MRKAINGKVLQKPRTQTPHFIPTVYRPHLVVKAAKKVAHGKAVEKASVLRAFLSQEEAEILARYNTNHNE